MVVCYILCRLSSSMCGVLLRHVVCGVVRLCVCMLACVCVCEYSRVGVGVWVCACV